MIIILGVTGNVLSFFVFAFTHLQRQSSSIYLATLAIVDTVFLLSLLIVWLGWLKIPLFHSNGWCQTVVYLNHLCGFLSVWSVVGFTTDRYIIVYHPLRKDRFCTSRRAKYVVLVLIIIGLIMYSFTTWTSGIMKINNISVCMPFPHFYDIITVMTSVDIIVTLLVPSSIIIVLNIRIVMKIHHFQETLTSPGTMSVLVPPRTVNSHRGTGMHASVSHNGSVIIQFGRPLQLYPLTDPDEDHSGAQQQSSATIVMVRGRSQLRLARMLLIVSSIFLLFNIPSHYFHIRAFLQHLVGGHYKGSKHILRWQELFQLVYYLNFAINFFLYSLCGRPFRTELKRHYTKLQYNIHQWRLRRSGSMELRAMHNLNG